MEKQQTPATMNTANAEPSAFLLELYNQHQDARLVFHNYAMALALSEKVAELCANAQVADGTREVAMLSAQLLLTGYLFDYRNPQPQSLRIAGQFLESHPQRDQVLACMQTVLSAKTPQTPESQYLSDAWQVCRFVENASEKSALLRLERTLLLNEELPEQDWQALQMQQLLSMKLYTHVAKMRYEQAIGMSMLSQKMLMEKGLSKGEKGGTDVLMRPFQGLSKRNLSGGAVQTFFRTNYRTHINLSAIADNKANIMISVNSILISVLISALSYRNIAETNPMVLLPAVIFLVTGLASLIFAVLSARPKVTRLLQKNMNIEVAKKNIVFFGNFVSLDLDRYEEAVDAALRNGELLYGNMARDLYHLGKVLDQKYRNLTLSYNIFMIGFIAAVGIFLVTFFLFS